jgi:probable HAF family extracellular repeat protein
VLRDLGTLRGDLSSFAFGINDRGLVLGQSCNSDFSVCRAFLWQDGVMMDLNTLIPAGSLFQTDGGDINNRGEIVVKPSIQVPGTHRRFWRRRVIRITPRVVRMVDETTRLSRLRPAKAQRSFSRKMFAGGFSNDWTSRDPGLA